jgi:hypothetical protein
VFVHADHAIPRSAPAAVPNRLQRHRCRACHRVPLFSAPDVFGRLSARVANRRFLGILCNHGAACDAQKRRRHVQSAPRVRVFREFLRSGVIFPARWPESELARATERTSLARCRRPPLVGTPCRLTRRNGASDARGPSTPTTGRTK